MTRYWHIAAAAAATLVVAACSSQDVPLPSPPATSAGASITLFLGDSYTEGTGLSTDELDSRWSTVLAQRESWAEINAGCNGSGYTRRGGVCASNYVERLPFFAHTEPDIVIVSGGVNDLAASGELVDTRVRQTFEALRETFPNAQIFAVNGIFYTGTITPMFLTYLNEAVEHHVEQVGGVYLDIGDPLLGRPELMAPDGLHPNPAGHELIADLTQAALVRSGVLPSVESTPGM